MAVIAKPRRSDSARASCTRMSAITTWCPDSMASIQVQTSEKRSSSTHKSKPEDESANALQAGPHTVPFGHLLFLLLDVEVALSDKRCPLELSLADLLNVHSIGALGNGGLSVKPARCITRGHETYIGDTKRAEPSVHRSKRSVLTDTLGAVGLDGSVDDSTGHGRDNKLRQISLCSSQKGARLTLAMPISLRAPLALALSIFGW